MSGAAPIGNRDGAGVSTVDEHGGLTPWPGGWRVDWLVRSSERWHAPAEERSLEQRLVGGMPVVETTMRVRGGQVVHTAWCARVGAGADEVAVIEVENRSKLPIAVALVVRTRRRMRLEGTVLRAGRGRALVLPRQPSRTARSIAELRDDDGPERFPDGVKGEAVVVFPLAHTASLRAAVPIGGGDVDLDAVPAADRVAAGWRTHAEPPGSMRLVLPDDQLAEAVLAARARALLPGVDPDEDLLRGVRDRLVREVDRETLAIAPGWPPGWAGQGFEVHDAPTRFGRLSYAVRWHGPRPALLWELDGPGARLTAPALDATWSSTDGRGEALLQPVGLPKVVAPLTADGVAAAAAPEGGEFS
jgi:hypothetical protein